MSNDLTIRIKPSIRGRLLDPLRFERRFAEAMEEVAQEAEVIFGAFALKRTGRMMRGIKTVRQGSDILVTITARNPTTGYDYVGVTRFGHKGMILPKARAPAVVLATGKSRKRGQTAMLRFMYHGRVVYARSTRGFHPSSDWAARALPTIEVEARRVLGRMARSIESGRL